MGNELLKQQNKEGLASLLDAMADDIAKVLPKHLTPARMAKVALVAAAKSPKLYQCTRETLALSIMEASELGLECSGTTGLAHLIPYGKDCTLIIGYRGYIELARRAGIIIACRLVYVKDEFDLDFGFGKPTPRIHKPHLEENRGEIKLVYAHGLVTKDSTTQFDYMLRCEVDKIRDVVLDKLKDQWKKDKSPWTTNYDEMTRKTMVRRLAKYLPQSAELQRAFDINDRAEGWQDSKRIHIPLVQDASPENLPKPALPAPAEPAPPETVEDQATDIMEQSSGDFVEDAQGAADLAQFKADGKCVGEPPNLEDVEAGAVIQFKKESE